MLTPEGKKVLEGFFRPNRVIDGIVSEPEREKIRDEKELLQYRCCKDSD